MSSLLEGVDEAPFRTIRRTTIAVDGTPIVMGTALLEALPEAVGIALSPTGVVLVLLLLASDHPLRNSWLFVVGRFAGLAVALVASSQLMGAVGITGEVAATDGGAWAINPLRVATGLLFIAVAVQQWMSRPGSGSSKATEKILRRVDALSGLEALALGAVTAVANAKNVPLLVSAGDQINRAGLTVGGLSAAVLAFVMVASVSVIGPVAYVQFAGPKSVQRIAVAKAWMLKNLSLLISAVFLGVGLLILEEGL